MKTFLAAVRELWGLFVEDASFTVAILVCIALAVFVLPRVADEHWCGPILFGALSLILFENVRRSAKQQR